MGGGDHSENRDPHAMTPSARRAAAAVSAGLALALLLASLLTPDARGYGTHEQLGLGECAFVRLWDMGCPSCGMTTSWAYLTQGDIRRAAGANVGGLLLGVYALVAIPWLLASALRGRWCSLRPSLRLLLPLLAVV